ncbi:MAG: FAD binding domain-containing protein, partial [Ilumatobacteraceae bacterium]
MSVIVPASLNDALQALARSPHATLLAGGTDLMVELNSGHRQVSEVVALA